MTKDKYGLGAVTAVLFPLAMYFRLYFPGQVLVAAMTPVTMGLVIGESAAHVRS